MQDYRRSPDGDPPTVPNGQFAQVQKLVAAQARDADGPASTVLSLQRLCRAAVRSLPMSGAAVSLMTEDGSSEVAAASDAKAEQIEELQFTLGEGPCLDAYATGRPVLMSTMADDGMARWPGYAPAALSHGVRALFALPLQIGAARLGTLNLYQTWAGALSAPVLSRALTFAEVATKIVLDGQEDAVPGESAAGLDHALESHQEVHQAQGMVMVQLGVDLQEAMVRLRAHAYATERSLRDVAGEIVARTLTLERDS